MLSQAFLDEIGADKAPEAGASWHAWRNYHAEMHDLYSMCATHSSLMKLRNLKGVPYLVVTLLQIEVEPNQFTPCVQISYPTLGEMVYDYHGEFVRVTGFIGPPTQDIVDAMYPFDVGVRIDASTTVEDLMRMTYSLD